MIKAALTALVLFAPVPAFAQTPAKPPPDVAVAPIECWWKTDRNAIRVGERFDLTLTCAVLDTDDVKVAVDESSLAPSALHLVPFEIVSGQRLPHEVWMEIDMPWVRACDILFRMDGASTGADMEVAEARSHGVPVVFSFEELDEQFGRWPMEELEEK